MFVLFGAAKNQGILKNPWLSAWGQFTKVPVLLLPAVGGPEHQLQFSSEN